MFNLTNRHITTLRSDGGGEFFNKEMHKYCQEHGIFQQKSQSYTPQQSGRAERVNRWIVEGVSAMLLDAQLPWSFWGFAAITKVWLKNRSPHSALHKTTPFELWTGRKPNLSALRVFGATGLVLIPSEKRKKTNIKSKPHIFVGYSEQSKAYIMYDPRSRTVNVSSEVVFIDESCKLERFLTCEKIWKINHLTLRLQTSMKNNS